MKSYFSLLTLVAATAGCSAHAEDFDETGSHSDAQGESEVGTVRSAIANGFAPHNSHGNAVALYHYSDAGRCGTKNHPAMWWPRPCSGVVIRQEGDVHYVLTARHCVTRDGTIQGTLLTGSGSIRATSSFEPGVLTVTETASSFQTTETPHWSWPAGEVVLAGTPANSSDHGADVAIVRVVNTPYAHIGPVAPYESVGLLMPNQAPDNSLVAGQYLTAFGYGRNDTTDGCSGHNASGAGILRWGSGYRVSSTQATTLVHESSNSYGQAVAHGDSGGPLFLYPHGQYILAGVNSSPVTAAGSHSLVGFVQAGLGHLYLSSMDNSARVVGSSGENNATLRTNYTSDSAQTRLVWDGGRLRMNGRCITDPNVENGILRLGPCDGVIGLYNGWRAVPGSNLIINQQTSRCMVRDGDYVRSRTCNTNSSAITFQWRVISDNKFE